VHFFLRSAWIGGDGRSPFQSLDHTLPCVDPPPFPQTRPPILKPNKGLFFLTPPVSPVLSEIFPFLGFSDRLTHAMICVGPRPPPGDQYRPSFPPLTCPHFLHASNFHMRSIALMPHKTLDNNWLRISIKPPPPPGQQFLAFFSLIRLKARGGRLPPINYPRLTFTLHSHEGK